MLHRVLYILASLTFALGVLGISIFRTAQPDYSFYQPLPEGNSQAFISQVKYELPHHGIMPDHLLWPIKAVRDQVWLSVTQDPIKRAQLILLFADKRISMADTLVQKGETSLGVSTASKAEQYLEETFTEYEKADKEGAKTDEFLTKLTISSVRHRELLETFVKIVPSDAIPAVIQIIDTPKMIYEKCLQELNRKNIIHPVLEEKEE